VRSSGGTQNCLGGTADVVLSSMTKIDDFGKDIWIGDSGASSHYCNNKKYDFTISVSIGLAQMLHQLIQKIVWEHHRV
jgi:hypothetical protein